MEKAAESAAKQFPNHRRVFIFDNSSVHRAKPADALNANKLNAYKTGGAVQRMKNTIWKDRQGHEHHQSLVDDNGEMRSLESLLRVRGLYKPSMNKNEMAAVLGAQQDFIEQKTIVEEMLLELGDGCLFLPRCHAELNPIELVWSAAKRYTRKKCKFKFKALRPTIEKALERISLATIRAYFERCDAWANAYREGKNFVQARAQVQQQAKERRAARAKAKAAAESPAAQPESSSDDEAQLETANNGSEMEVEHQEKPPAKPSAKGRSNRSRKSRAKATATAGPPSQKPPSAAAKQPSKAAAKPKAKAAANSSKPRRSFGRAAAVAVGPSQVLLFVPSLA